MEHHPHYKRKRHKSNSGIPDFDEDNKHSIKKEDSTSNIAILRAERLERERREQLRTKQLLAPKKEPVSIPKHLTKLDEDRTRKYNSQFNPEFTRNKN